MEREVNFYLSHEFSTTADDYTSYMLCDKDVYETFGVFDLQYKSAADYDLMLRLYQTKHVTFTPVMKVLSEFSIRWYVQQSGRVRENLKVRYKYGYLSKKQLLLGTVKSKIYQWLHERKK